MGKITRTIQLLGLAAIMNLLGCNSEKFTLAAETPTPVYEDYPSDGPPKEKSIAVLYPGETVEIIQTRYAKDAAYYKVRLKNGQEGYVGWGGKFKIEAVKRN